MKQSTNTLKLILNLAVVAVLAAATVSAQIPQAMNYQAVVRDINNELVVSSPVSVRITILQGILSDKPVYSEVHNSASNSNGLVTLQIGTGTPLLGTFSSVNWANGPYYIKTETSINGADNFAIAGVSPLLSVPYAMRAETAATADMALNVDYFSIANRPLNVSSFFNDAGYITREELSSGKVGESVLVNNNNNTNGTPSNVWSLAGNSGTNSSQHRIGTTDEEDMVFITNNTERFRITADGDITISNGLSVGDNVEVGTDLIVKHNVYMNTVDGQTINYGDFTVSEMSSTYLTGTLTVDKQTWLNDILDVDGATTLNNTLDVDGATTLNSTLDVDGATTVNNTLGVTSDQTGHVATITNTNNGNGDGLLIKLGKTHGAWDGSEYLQIATPGSILVGSTLDVVKGWLNGESFEAADLWEIFPGAAIAGALAQVTNTIIDEINDGLNLPVTIVPEVTVFPGYSLNLPDVPSIEMPKVCLSFGELGSACAGPWTLFGGLTIPNIDIPQVKIGPYQLPAIPNIPANGLPTIEIPNFSGTSVTNSLTRENHFITFQDKDGRQAGAIKAESVNDWRDNTVLDDVYLTNLAASFIGIDLLGAAVNGFSEINELVDQYNKIGVAYESGNGDYAEWLERADVAEQIVPGDVVGVRGGKISKNIDGAEQVMVVSHKPIVLGNMPNTNRRQFGNDVAFMGQVPVKVLGAVRTGDYIVASGNIKGYAVAVSPASMKAEDFTKVVGRSWENIPSEGPKMVNTVIGVHNGEWVKIVKKLDDRQTQTEKKLQTLESKIDQIMGVAAPVEKENP